MIDDLICVSIYKHARPFSIDLLGTYNSPDFQTYLCTVSSKCTYQTSRLTFVLSAVNVHTRLSDLPLYCLQLAYGKSSGKRVSYIGYWVYKTL